MASSSGRRFLRTPGWFQPPDHAVAFARGCGRLGRGAADACLGRAPGVRWRC
jgi:hypothetical protein